MALVVKDRVQETSTTTGTGTFTLAGAVTGFQSFSVIGNGNTTYYAIVGGTEWEVGLGTYTSSGTTLSRDTILESSNGGTAVNFSAGTKNVFVTYPAEKGLYLDASGNAIALGTPASATLTNATGLPLSTGVTGTLPVANGGTGITSLGTGVATFLGTPSSANLASAVTDETGSGSLVFATSPTLTTPVLGTPSSGTLTSCTGLPLTTGVTGTLPVANGGTGATSQTAYAVLAGGTTSTGAYQSVASVGTSGQILTSNGASALPTFQDAAASPYVLKNRIINGDMRIDQRNAGASLTPTATGGFLVDRWKQGITQASKLTFQRNAGSVTPPAGFTNYLGVTTASAYSVTSSDVFLIQQPIEGFNVSDFAWGTASAVTVTLSFWVRSSLTGTFGGAVSNNARSYPFSYTISASNTWEKKSVTIAGDTSGTWSTDNSNGMQIRFAFGSGATYSGTAGAWTAGDIYSATGAVSVVGTLNATLYITGVQLEIGSTATPFERRLHNQELANCQRYYETTAVNGAFSISETQVQIVWNAAYCTSPQFKVTKRATPTVTIYSRSGTSGQVSSTASGADVSAATASNISATGIWSINLSSGQTVYSAGMEAGFTASAEL